MLVVNPKHVRPERDKIDLFIGATWKQDLVPPALQYTLVFVRSFAPHNMEAWLVNSVAGTSSVQ